ncbi:hypothetical protein BGZ98_006431 [Dissophora globulifera]|nr:hypothetical protein BGZ98_006431 [Dissophora globulifera]
MGNYRKYNVVVSVDPSLTVPGTAKQDLEEYKPTCSTLMDSEIQHVPDAPQGRSEPSSAEYIRAQSNSCVLATKLVRGAYMVSEHKRVTELGLKDPICDGIQATHKSYNAGVDFMLEKMAQRQQKLIENASSSSNLSLVSPPVAVFVVSHKKDSVIRTSERVQELVLSQQSGLVMFGQLMSMCIGSRTRSARTATTSTSTCPMD